MQATVNWVELCLSLRDCSSVLSMVHVTRDLLPSPDGGSATAPVRICRVDGGTSTAREILTIGGVRGHGRIGASSEGAGGKSPEAWAQAPPRMSRTCDLAFLGARRTWARERLQSQGVTVRLRWHLTDAKRYKELDDAGAYDQPAPDRGPLTRAATPTRRRGSASFAKTRRPAFSCLASTTIRSSGRSIRRAAYRLAGDHVKSDSWRGPLSGTGGGMLRRENEVGLSDGAPVRSEFSSTESRRPKRDVERLPSWPCCTDIPTLEEGETDHERTRELARYRVLKAGAP